jgi:hypothetical protein
MATRQGISRVRVVVPVPVPGLIRTTDVREALGVGPGYDRQPLYRSALLGRLPLIAFGRDNASSSAW